MTSDNIKNDFLVDLLTLQQDGNQSISAPTNWISHEPLLEISTEIDDIVNELGSSILSGNNQNTARWHFFIGSPGNGKSAAMGKLCRHLINERGCQIKDEQGCSIQELEPTNVPYALNVYEGNNKYVTALIVQDASVVRNPFSPNVDPANELMITLKDAWDRGISLIICTNRGVIEKAHRDNHTNSETNHEPWFRIINSIVNSKNILNGEFSKEWNFEGKKTVFQNVKITYSHLDNKSLLIGEKIFDRLLEKAVAPINWESCEECKSKNQCPFRANRDWLNDSDGREKILNILRRAEVFSGQIIVFREALALISLILAGCPRDYRDGHPCMWVEEKISKGDIFSLIVRRIYMILFTSFTPFGLDPAHNIKNHQIEALKLLAEEVQEDHQDIKDSLKRVIKGSTPSTDVGVTRLLGENGVLSKIDPCFESLPSFFQDFWDGDYKQIQHFNNPFITPIEHRCIEIWAYLEQALEFMPTYTASKTHWALRRWSSNFLLHFGVLLEGRTAWAKELDQFLQVLNIVIKPLEDRTREEKRILREIDKDLEEYLDTNDSNHQESASLKLSETVVLAGEWAKDNLKPRTVKDEQTSSLSLSIKFGGAESANEGEEQDNVGKERAALGAQMFLWLSRRARNNLDSRCFPSELLTGVVDAKIRAAAKSKYAFAEDGVELIVTTEEGEVFRLSRFDGEVEVTYE